MQLTKPWKKVSEKGCKHVYYNEETGRRKVFTVNKMDSKTDGSFKKMCDAKEVVNKFKTTGILTHTAKKEGRFADVSEVNDLHASMIKLDEARHEFMQIPAKIRKKFDNDMRKYYAFLADPKNDEEAVKLGLKSYSPQADEQIKAQKEARNARKPKQDTSSDNDDSKDTKSSKKDSN